MRLNTARQMWHDAYHQPASSVMGYALEIGRLGAAVQRTQRSITAGAAAHQAMAGHVQKAIGTLPAPVADFGHHLYSPLAGIDQRERAEDLIFSIFDARRLHQGVRMTADKRDKTEYAAKLCLYRYRRMHQGGMSAGADPLPTAEAFRVALNDVYGVHLPSGNWARDWAPALDELGAICSDIDRLALRPVAKVLALFLEAA